MQHLIDSDWFIDYLDSIPAAVALITPLARGGLGISVVAYIEVYQGVYRQNSAAAERELESVLAVIPIVPLSLPVAQRCARLWESLRSRGRRTGSRALDLIIAATAIEHDLTLVTRHTADYQDIPGLKLYR